jgi:hypothetical protein
MDNRPDHFKVVDPDGIWLRTAAKFPMIDSFNATRFAPGAVTQATKTVWVGNQIEAGVLVETDEDGNDLVKAEVAAADGAPAEGLALAGAEGGGGKTPDAP